MAGAAQERKKDRVLWCVMKGPIRGLRKVRDLYVRSIMGFTRMNRCTAPCPPGRRRRTGNGGGGNDDDFMELVLAAVGRGPEVGGPKGAAHGEVASATKTRRVGIGRIDEEKEMEMDGWR